MTSNPSIFAARVEQGRAPTTPRSPSWPRAAPTATRPSGSITTDDVRDACDVLRPVYDATDGVDGRVSIEVDPRLAHDTEQTIAEARALWRTVDQPNLLIKIPGTLEGLPGDHRRPWPRGSASTSP